MTCTTIDLGNGDVAIVCRRGVRRPMCSTCGARPSAKQCDFPLKGSKSGKTCSRHLCDQCAVEMPERTLAGDTVDYCPPHARIAAARPQQQELLHG